MDKYLGFTFNGKSLGIESTNDFNGFIKNDFEELAFNMPTFSNSFVTPTYGDKPFYLGNTKEHRTFDLDIVLNEITLDEYRKFLKWLGMDKKGVLKFDYNLNYGYDVKLDSIGKANFIAIPQPDINNIPSPDKYIIEIPITFITTGDWAARWVNEVYWSGSIGEDLVDNELETDFVEFDGNDIKFTNKHNLPNYFILETGDDGAIIVKIDNVDLPLPIIIPQNTKFFSQYGIGIGTTNNTFSEITNSRIIEIPPMGDLTITLDEITSETITKITPTSREII